VLAEHFGVKQVKLILPGHGTQLVAPESQFPISTVIGSVTIRQGRVMDGAATRPEEAVFLATADCPAIVIRHENSRNIWVLHGGRECLIDRGALNGKRRRKCPSIVDALFARSDVQKLSREGFHVFSACGIGPFPHPQNHPEHGEYNAKLLTYITDRWGEECVDGGDSLLLHNIIRAQCTAHDVPVENISSDGIDTLRTTWNGAPVFWSTHRGDTVKRNGVFIVNCA